MADVEYIASFRLQSHSPTANEIPLLTRHFTDDRVRNVPLSQVQFIMLKEDGRLVGTDAGLSLVYHPAAR